MREIKFRAWDKPNNAMIQKVAVYGHAMGTSVMLPHGDYAPGKHWRRDDYGNYYCYDGSVVPLQYTGLKDKNGVEIHEGDILRCNSSDDDWNDHVVFRNASFNLSRWAKKVSHIYPDLMDVLDDCEVVGNIYENPELLEVN